MNSTRTTSLFSITPLGMATLFLCTTPLSGCATLGSHTGLGWVRTNHYEGVLVTGNPAGKKRGTACTENYFGLVTSGDATLSAAMKDGAITSVSSVDQHYESTLGVYAKMCTIVTGN